MKMLLILLLKNDYCSFNIIVNENINDIDTVLMCV